MNFSEKVAEIEGILSEIKLEYGSYVIIEKKTGKKREVKVNRGLQAHIQDCYKSLCIIDRDELCFVNKYGKPISTQMINRHLKTIKSQYGLKIEHRDIEKDALRGK